MWVQSLGWEDPLEKGMVTHSDILAWRIPWTEEPGGLQNNARYPLCIGFDILKIISPEMNSVLKKLSLGICRGDLNVGHEEVAECRGAVLVAQSYLTLQPWTVAPLAPLSIEFSRQQYWSGYPRPSPGDLPDAGIEPMSPALQVNCLPSELPAKLRGAA